VPKLNAAQPPHCPSTLEESSNPCTGNPPHIKRAGFQHPCEHYKLRNITCTLVATDVILQSLECTSEIVPKLNTAQPPHYPSTLEESLNSFTGNPPPHQTCQHPTSRICWNNKYPVVRVILNPAVRCRADSENLVRWAAVGQELYLTRCGTALRPLKDSVLAN
jgi:hypothetical protein